MLCPLVGLGESLWRSRGASCVAYEDPSLPCATYVSGGGYPPWAALPIFHGSLLSRGPYPL
eukprot:13082860-Alexandrium_andersonii.AAC.1